MQLCQAAQLNNHLTLEVPHKLRQVMITSSLWHGASVSSRPSLEDRLICAQNCTDTHDAECTCDSCFVCPSTTTADDRRFREPGGCNNMYMLALLIRSDCRLTELTHLNSRHSLNRRRVSFPYWPSVVPYRGRTQAVHDRRPCISWRSGRDPIMSVRSIVPTILRRTWQAAWPWAIVVWSRVDTSPCQAPS